MRIGIFGGSFNPVHNMHIDIANYLIKNNYLDKVIFVPTGIHYTYKNNLISNKHRYNMLLLATQNTELLISDYELKNREVHTYETLEYFKNKYYNDEIYFICGTDNLSYMDKWKKGKYILNTYKIIVINRNTNKIEKRLLDNKNIIVCNMKSNDISSTIIRENIKNNKSIDKYICKSVKNYIVQNNLYLE